MADQKNRGGQKQGQQRPSQPKQKQGQTTEASGGRAHEEKRRDQSNPDDARRQG